MCRLSTILRSISEPPKCDCATCRGMCERIPCWPTQEEAVALISAGLGPKLMVAETPGGIALLCPATPGSEGRSIAWPHPWSQATLPCVFYGPGGCSLHDRGLKPIEGRYAHCRVDVPDDLHEAIAESWDTKGRRLVSMWIRRFGAKE